MTDAMRTSKIIKIIHFIIGAILGPTKKYAKPNIYDFNLPRKQIPHMV